MRRRHVRPERDRLGKCRDHLLGRTLAAQHNPKVVMRLSPIRPNRNRPPQKIRRNVIPSQSVLNQSQEMQSFGELRPLRHNLLADALSLPQTPGAMMPQRQFVSLLDRHLRHDRRLPKGASIM